MVAAGGIRMSIAAKSASRSSSHSVPPSRKFIDSPQWQEAVSQNPGLAPFFDNLESFVELPEGVEKLRSLVLDLAVRGKLVTQDSDDEPASELLRKVANKSAKAILPEKDQPYQLPATWAWTKLGSVTEIQMGNSPPGTSYNETGEGVPLINGPVEFSPGPFGPTLKTKFTTEPTKFCKTGDLLICVRGSTTGRTNIAAFDACIGRGVAAIRSKIFDGYVNQVILSMRSSIYESGTGSTFKSISQKQLIAYPFPLPPLAEQRRIVSKVEGLMSLCDTLELQRRALMRVRERASRSVLASLTSAPVQLPAHEDLDRDRRRERQGASRRSSTVDVDPPQPTATALSLTRNTTESNGPPTGETLASAWQRLSDHFEVLLDQPETLAHLRQSILQLAVQGKLVPQDPSDEPASELLENISDERDDKSKPKKRPSKRFPSDEDIPHEIPESWIWTTFEDVAGIASNLVKPSEFQAMPHIAPNHIEKETGRLLEYRTVAEDKVTSNKHRFFAGQILYSKIRPNLSKVVVVDFDGLCSADMYPIDCFIHVPYLHQYILSQTFLRMVVKSDTRVAMPKTNQTELKKVLVALPPKAEQKRIVSKVSVLLSQLDELSARLRSRQSTTDALLTALIHQVVNGVDVGCGSNGQKKSRFPTQGKRL